MKISHRCLANSLGAFQAISGIKLPVATAFAFSRAGKRVEDALNDYEKVRTSLVNQHAVKDSDGQVVGDDQGRATFGDRAAFEKDLNALLELEVDINVEPIPLQSLGDINIEPMYLSVLDWLLTDG